jgi:hypothetical protein
MTIRIKDFKGINLQGVQKRGRYPVAEKSRRTMDSIVFASRGEMLRYASLKLREKIGDITGLELQPAFPVRINDRVFYTYTADFRYVDSRTGLVVVEDVKSSGTAKDDAYRLRKLGAELYYSFHVTEIMPR